MVDKELFQTIANTLISDRGMAGTHVVQVLTSDTPLNIGSAITELNQVFGERHIRVITDELAYIANDLASAASGSSVDSASRFYYQLLLSDKAALAAAINTVLLKESTI